MAAINDVVEWDQAFANNGTGDPHAPIVVMAIRRVGIVREVFDGGIVAETTFAPTAGLTPREFWFHIRDPQGRYVLRNGQYRPHRTTDPAAAEK